MCTYVCVHLLVKYMYPIVLFQIGRRSVYLNPKLLSLSKNITTITKSTSRATAANDPVPRCVCVWNISLVVSVYVKCLLAIIMSEQKPIPYNSALALCYVNVHTCTYMDMRTCMNVHHAHVHTHTHMHTHTHTHTHTRTEGCMRMCSFS